MTGARSERTTQRTDEVAQTQEVAGADPVRQHVRGSGLLVVGRIFSVGVNLGIQVLIVRHFTKASYGALAYALSLVQSIELVIAFGLDRALTRFLAIYDEQRRDGELLGTLVLQFAVIVAAGISVIAFVVGLQGWLTGHLIHDSQTTALLVVLIILAPIGALDSVLLGVFSVYARPKVIFLRRYVITPLLRLAIVAAVILGSGDVESLAIGYVFAGIVGLAFYLHALRKLMRSTGLGGRLRRARLSIPYRSLLGFTAPLLTSDLVYFSMAVSTVLLLGRYGGPTDVAAFTVVLSPARTIQMVMASAGLLFTPVAARAFARRDDATLADLYWSTAALIAVASFPLFALTSIFAEPLTVALFGERYQSSAPLLTILALGYYVNVCLGFNGVMLKVAARLRYLITINIAAASINVALCVVLIPRFAATGAALATTGTLLAHNMMKQAGLRRAGGIAPFDTTRAGIYATIGLATAGLWLLAQTISSSLVAGVAAVAVVSTGLLVGCGRRLELERHFPELHRLPIIGPLLLNERS